MGAENVDLMSSLNRILARDIVAGENIPPFDRSPFDGYAMRAEDVAAASADSPAELEVIETIPAGYVPKKTLGPGQTAKIMTGAPVPRGADCVAKFEDVRAEGGRIFVAAPFYSGQNVVRAGEDIAKGATAARRGAAIGPGTIGSLASLGVTDVPVFLKPKVAVIGTGDEIAPADSVPPPGKIRNSGVFAVAGALAALGASPILSGIIRDDANAIGAAIGDALRGADMVITTGGVSVGDYDFVMEALERISAGIIFWRVRIKPGAAVIAARKNGKMILCLSGSPGAAMTTFHLLGAPFVRRMAGRAEWKNREIGVILRDGFMKRSHRDRIVRGTLLFEDGMAVMAVDEKQGNGVLSSFAGAALLGVIPKDSGPLPPGARIKAYLT
jgi:molybdopterin molybdotransferase